MHAGCQPLAQRQGGVWWLELHEVIGRKHTLSPAESTSSVALRHRNAPNPLPGSGLAVVGSAFPTHQVIPCPHPWDGDVGEAGAPAAPSCG